MRGEERRHVVVEEGEARGAEARGVGGEVELAADDAGFERGRAVAAVPVAREDGGEVGEEEHVDARVRGNVLAEAQVSGVSPEVALLQELEGSPLAMEDVGAGGEALAGVHEMVEWIQRR